MFYFYEDQARNLQSVFDELLHVIETNKAEIWVAQSKDVEAGTFEYGPGATVQQILEKKNNAANTSSMTKKNSMCISLYLFYSSEGNFFVKYGFNGCTI